MKNHVLYFTDKCQIAVKEESIPSPEVDEILIKNVISGISSGTEMLFYNGLIPNDMLLDDTIKTLQHPISYPFKYGYCSVGKVVEVGHTNLNHLLDRYAFAFNPHESYFCTKEDQLILLPDEISPYDALFIPNMETAVNLVLDGAPLIGENILVFGLGIVGLLTTAILKQFPLSVLMGIDLYPKRRAICHELGAKATLDASGSELHSKLKSYLSELKHNHVDLIYELTGNPDALNSAISFAGFEGRIVLGSWYGNKPCQIDLGGRFHRQRLSIISSQVSTLASKHRSRWTKIRRLDNTLDMLKKIKPAHLISHGFHITNASQAYQLLQHKPEETLLVTLTYEA